MSKTVLVSQSLISLVEEIRKHLPQVEVFVCNPAGETPNADIAVLKEDESISPDFNGAILTLWPAIAANPVMALEVLAIGLQFNPEPGD